jgi:O-antigen/teichoic acid export membrane protein
LIVNARLVAIAGYGVQACLALGTVLAVAWVLPAPEFSRYSVMAAVAQFGAILAFEWIRIGAMRFYPGADSSTAVAERGAIGRLFPLSALALGVPAFAIMYFALGLTFAGLILALAIVQALSDLHMTLVRFRGALPRFSRMQLARSLLLFAGTIAGAWQGGAAAHALLGLLGGHLLGLGTNLLFDGRYEKSSSGPEAVAEKSKYWRYGAPAATASVLHSSVPVGVRAMLIALFGEAGAAGLVLALDLFQRPLALIAVALNGVLYPDVVREHAKGPGKAAARQKLYVANIAALAIGSGLLIAFAAEIASIAVRNELRADFILAAPWLVLFFLLRSLTQNILSVHWHLEIRPWILAVFGAADMLLCFGAVALAVVLMEISPVILMAALGIAAALLTGMALAVQWRHRQPLPRPLLAFVALCLPLYILIGMIAPFGGAAAIGTKATAAILLTASLALLARAAWKEAQ